MRKIVIFGYSKTGREIAKLLLNDEYDVTVIDENPMLVALANEEGFFARQTTLKDDKVLTEVGIGDGAEVLFCVSDDDSLNLFVTFSARNLDKKIKILTKIIKKEDKKKMLLAGANRTISPYNVGAAKAFRIIQKPKLSRVLSKFSALKNKISIREVVIPEKSFLDGVSLNKVDISKDTNLIFLGLLSKKMGEKFIFFTKDISYKLNAGDILIVIGSRKDSRIFEEKLWK